MISEQGNTLARRGKNGPDSRFFHFRNAFRNAFRSFNTIGGNYNKGHTPIFNFKEFQHISHYVTNIAAIMLLFVKGLQL
jgi:hypothetical protein